MLTEKDVNVAFDGLEQAFKGIAELEDKITECGKDLQEYKEGSRKADRIKKRMQEIQPKLSKAQRAYQLAAMRVDRLRSLLDVAKTAMGRD